MQRVKDGPFKYLAIAGPPGAGKTTLARGLKERLGWSVLSTGDIARRIDPESLANGGVADPVIFARAFREALDAIDAENAMDGWSDQNPPPPLILDGIPRYREQLDLLPESTVLVAVTCRIDICIDRQLRRGRPGDDDREMVEFRTRGQAGLLEVDQADGWLYQTAGWGAVVNTSRDLPAKIADDMVAYLTGQKREAF